MKAIDDHNPCDCDMDTTLDTISLNVLKSLLKFGLFSVQVLGIWPYRYDRKSKSFHTTKILSCYTAVVLPFILFAYIFALKSIKINDDLRVHIPSSTGRFTTVCLSVIVISVYSITSVYQITNHNSINDWLRKSRNVVDQIHCFRTSHAPLPFLRLILHFLVNVVLLNGFIIYATIGTLWHLISDRTAGKSWLIVLYILPYVSLTIVSDIFYGSMLTTTYYYRFLNLHLRNILQELHHNPSQTSKNSRSYILMEQFGHLADELDNVASLHLQVTMCTKFTNRIFSVHLMCFMVCEVFVFISKLFIIFIILESEFRRQRTIPFNYSVLWYNAVVLVVAIWTIGVLLHSCHTTMKESEKTTEILSSVSLNKSIDVRLRRSMDTFSVQLANNKLRLTVCGLYGMDHKILHSILGTAISYTFILIHFELME